MINQSAKPGRPALRYYGGKWACAKHIIARFPLHDCYCEPFGGGASVLLQKEPAFSEFYNDINSDVTNFFTVLRENGDKLVEAVQNTPYSREEFRLAQETSSDLSPVERARRFFVWSWQGRGRAGVKEPGGWRFMTRATRGKTPVDDFYNTDHLYAVRDRLKKVHIENDDALKIIERCDTPKTLFYVDPPYVTSTRSQRWGLSAYAFEYTDQQHDELAETLKNVQGMVIISGYRSEIYDDLYRGWQMTAFETRKDSGDKAQECLWLSPNITKQERQFNLFESA